MWRSLSQTSEPSMCFTGLSMSCLPCLLTPNPENCPSFALPYSLVLGQCYNSGRLVGHYSAHTEFAGCTQAFSTAHCLDQMAPDSWARRHSWQAQPQPAHVMGWTPHPQQSPKHRLRKKMCSASMPACGMSSDWDAALNESLGTTRNLSWATSTFWKDQARIWMSHSTLISAILHL